MKGTGALLIRDARATAVEGSGRYWSPADKGSRATAVEGSGRYWSPADKGCQSYSSGRQWKVLEPC